jgi:hypothetical protein
MTKKTPRGATPTDDYYKSRGFARLSLRVMGDVREALDARVKGLGEGWTVTDLVTSLVRYHEKHGWPTLTPPTEDQEK